ncbi:MAG: hypothetical protein NVS9B10_02530 [Nevskia sp.]
MMMIGQRPEGGVPDATTPQANAHMGGNQVIGFRSSATADRAGRAMEIPDGYSIEIYT